MVLPVTSFLPPFFPNVPALFLNPQSAEPRRRRTHTESKLFPSKSPVPQTRSAGFSVIEVFLVVTLLSAILALVIFNFFTFEGSLDDRPAFEQTRRSIAESHRLARERRESILLHYDPERAVMVLSDEKGQMLDEFAFPPGTEAQVKFFRIKPEAEMREEPDFEAEEEDLPTLAFHPYGSSAPFQLEFEQGTEAVTLRYDPFSGLSWERTDIF